MTTYTTINDYITENIAPGLGDVTITIEQAQEIAHRMTEWQNGKLVEREDLEFWEVVEDVLENWEWELDTITEDTHNIEAIVGEGYRPVNTGAGGAMVLEGDTLAEMIKDALDYVTNFDYFEDSTYIDELPEPRFELEELTWDGPNVLVRYADQSEGQYGYLQITANLK